MKQQFVDKGIPLIIGEYAAMKRSNLPADAQALHLKSHEYYVHYRRTNAVNDGTTLAAILKGAGKR